MPDETPSALRVYLTLNQGKLASLHSGASVLFHSDAGVTGALTITIGVAGRPYLDWVCVLRETEDGVVATYTVAPGELDTAFTGGDASAPEALVQRLAAFLGGVWAQRTKSGVTKVAVRSRGGIVTAVDKPHGHSKAVADAQANAARAGVDIAPGAAYTHGYVLADGVFVDADTAFKITKLMSRFESTLIEGFDTIVAQG